jgi:hypothetical protein
MRYFSVENNPFYFMAKQKVVSLIISNTGGLGGLSKKIENPSVDALLDEGYIVKEVNQIATEHATVITFVLTK